MILKHHKDLNIDKWSGFPVPQRILMIGTEFIRAGRSLERQRKSEVIDCYERALELLDLTIETVRGSLLRELLRLRDVVALKYFRKEMDWSANNRIYNVLISLNKDAFNSLQR